MNFLYQRDTPVCRLILALVLVTLLSYLPSLWNGFVFDDVIHVQNNKAIRNWGALLLSLLSPLYPGDLYRPMFSLSLGATFLISGLDPFLYHFGNLVLHCLNVSLLFYIASCLVSRRVALLGTLLFAVHPLHTEAVANITGRAELLAHLFGLAFLALFLRRAKTEYVRFTERDCLVLALLFLGSVLSKESGVVYVPLALVLAWHLGSYRFDSTNLFRLSTYLFFGLVVYCLLRLFALGPVLFSGGGYTSLIDNPLQHVGFFERVVSAAALLGRYWAMSVVPVHLSADYSYQALLPFTEAPDMAGLLCLLLIAGYFILGIKKFIDGEVQGLFILWFFLAFSITSNVLKPIGTIFGERLAYLPSIGVIFYMVLLLEKIRIREFYYLLVIFSYAVITALHCTVWYSNETLFEYQLAHSGRSVKTLNNLASLRLKEGDVSSATRLWSRAVELMPEYGVPRVSLARIWFNQGRVDAAVAELEAVLELKPHYSDASNLLAAIHFSNKNFTASKAQFQVTLQKDPFNIPAHTGLLAVAIELDDIQMAMRQYGRLNSLGCKSAECKSLMGSLEGLLKFKKGSES